LEQPEDLRTTLFVSEREALFGSTRVVTLPGKRRVTFPVPAGVRDGEQIRLKGQGLPSFDDGPPGDLIITIMYRQTRELAAFNTSAASSSPESHALEEIPTHPLGSRHDHILPDIEDIPTNPPGSSKASLPGMVGIGDMPPFPMLPGNAQFLPDSGNASSYNVPPPFAGPPSGLQSMPYVPSHSPHPLLKRRTLSLQEVLLILLIVLVIVGSGGLLIITLIHQSGNGNALATATARSAPRTAQAGPSFPFSNTLLLSDPLRDNSKGKKWEEDGDSSGSCSFIGGVYHASISLQNRFRACIALNFHASNFSYQVQMQVLKGDCGGLIFRRSGPKFYYFRVCGDGSYAFIRYASDNNTALNLTLTSGTHPAIHQGLKQVNVLAVAASGSKLALYVNRQLIASIQDTSYTDGQIGLVAKAKGNATEVAYSNLMIWML
jgi:hypothetical protein